MSARVLLPTPLGERLAKIIPLLGSDSAGERDAAVAAIGRALEGAGFTWHDLAELVGGKPPASRVVPDGRGLAALLLHEAFDRLTDWEVEFCTTVLRAEREPSPKQREKLRQIYYQRVADEEAA
jgi:hypothetical protein